MWFTDGSKIKVDKRTQRVISKYKYARILLNKEVHLRSWETTLPYDKSIFDHNGICLGRVLYPAVIRTRQVYVLGNCAYYHSHTDGQFYRVKLQED